MRIPESLPMRAKSKHVDKRSKSPKQYEEKMVEESKG